MVAALKNPMDETRFD